MQISRNIVNRPKGNN